MLLAHNLNDSYLVCTPNERFILRIYQAPRAHGRSWRSLSDVLYELDLLRHLAHKGIPVSVPLARKDGTFVRTLQAPEGPRQAVLFTYAPGTPVSQPTLDADLSRLYGRAIAEFHSASEDYVSQHARFALDLEFLLEQPLQTIQPLLVHRSDDWAYLLQVAAEVRARMAEVAEGLEMGVCHGDALGGNAHLSADQGLTFFDFDVCGWGWCAYDLAVFYWGCALGKSRLGRSDEEVERLWQAYLGGYLERRQLGELDRRALPLLVVLRHFWFLGLHTANWENWGIGEVDDRFFDRELDFLREWMARHL